MPLNFNRKYLAQGCLFVDELLRLSNKVMILTDQIHATVVIFCLIILDTKLPSFGKHIGAS